MVRLLNIDDLGSSPGLGVPSNIDGPLTDIIDETGLIIAFKAPGYRLSPIERCRDCDELCSASG